MSLTHSYRVEKAGCSNDKIPRTGRRALCTARQRNAVGNATRWPAVCEVHHRKHSQGY